MRLDPHYPNLYPHILGWAEFCLENYAEAVLAFEEASKLNPEEERTYPSLGSDLCLSWAQTGCRNRSFARFSAIEVTAGVACRRTLVMLSTALLV